MASLVLRLCNGTEAAHQNLINASIGGRRVSGGTVDEDGGPWRWHAWLLDTSFTYQEYPRPLLRTHLIIIPPPQIDAMGAAVPPVVSVFLVSNDPPCAMLT
jgi:hypothetical protein